MPKVNKRTARQDIWSTGIKVPSDKTKSKFRRDRSVPYMNERGEAADRLLVAKGEVYYQWKFKNGGERISKTYPKRQQLTQSDFLIQLYDLEDRLDWLQADDVDSLQSERDSLVEDINVLKEEQEEKLSNMPDQLQYAPSGELLQERADGLDNWALELEGVDLDDFDEPDDEDIAGDIGLIKDEDGEYSDDQKEEIEEVKNSQLQSWIDEKVQELQSITSGL